MSPVRTRFVFEQLSSLKAGKLSTGMEGICVRFLRFLRDGADLLAGPLCHVINLSITPEVVPAKMKEARVTPLNLMQACAKLILAKYLWYLSM